MARENRHDTDYHEFLPLFRQLADDTLSRPAREKLRDRIVESHLALAEHIAQKYQHRGQAFDDLTQVARMGLIGAVDRFDPERGTDFVSFAVPTIMGEVRRYFRDSTWMISVPRRLKELNRTISRTVATLTSELGHAPRPQQIAARLNISLEAVYEGLQAGMAYQAGSLDSAVSRGDGEGPEPGQFGVADPGLDRVENRETLHSALAGLPARENEIVRMRFVEELTQRQIADRLGISQVHVSRLLSSTVARLRESFVPQGR